MRCKPQGLVSEQIPVRNGGDIPVNVSLSLTNSKYFSLSPEYLYIKPGQVSNYRLNFSTSSVTNLTELISWLVHYHAIVLLGNVCTMHITMLPVPTIFPKSFGFSVFTKKHSIGLKSERKLSISLFLR